MEQHWKKQESKNKLFDCQQCLLQRSSKPKFQNVRYVKPNLEMFVTRARSSNVVSNTNSSCYDQHGL